MMKRTPLDCLLGLYKPSWKTKKADEYINHFKFVSSQNEETKINFFESLPKTLQAQVSKPSANPEVNQAVFDGDIKAKRNYSS